MKNTKNNIIVCISDACDVAEALRRIKSISYRNNTDISEFLNEIRSINNCSFRKMINVCKKHRLNIY